MPVVLGGRKGSHVPFRAMQCPSVGSSFRESSYKFNQVMLLPECHHQVVSLQSEITPVSRPVASGYAVSSKRGGQVPANKFVYCNE